MSRIRAADLKAMARRSRRRAVGLTMPPALARVPKWVWWAGGAGIVGLILYSMRGSIMSLAGRVVQAGQEAAFAAALPTGVRDYASEIRAASAKYGVSPWALAGVVYRESNGGLALKPKGPGGTGDFIPRASSSTYFKYADPSTGLPPDGLGWGRGLAQIDYGVHHDWIMANNWANPAVNLNKAASILAENQAYFQRAPGGPVTVQSWRLEGLFSKTGSVIVAGWRDKYGLTSTGPFRDPRPLSGDLLMQATLDAFNAGTGGVLQALAAGLPPSAATAKNDYSSWIFSRAASWASKFDQLIV